MGLVSLSENHGRSVLFRRDPDRWPCGQNIRTQITESRVRRRAEAVSVACRLNELVFNALKHQPAEAGKKRARVTLCETEDAAEVRITNRGGCPRASMGSRVAAPWAMAWDWCAAAHLTGRQHCFRRAAAENEVKVTLRFLPVAGGPADERSRGKKTMAVQAKESSGAPSWWWTTTGWCWPRWLKAARRRLPCHRGREAAKMRSQPPGATHPILHARTCACRALAESNWADTCVRGRRAVPGPVR